MTDGRNGEMILKVTFSLLLFSLLEQGVRGQCSTPPKNQAYYEGTANTAMTCNGPIPVSWFVTPTNDELMSRKITNLSDTVLVPFTNIYDVTQTNLNIRIDQSTAVLPNIATSGLYVAQNTTSGSNNKVGAKLVVVRGPPTCNCTAINSTSNNITCTVTYADYSFNPIYPKVTWTADGAFIKNDTLSQRTRVNGAWPSTSTITTSVYDTRVYECKVTFMKPMNIAIAYIATNAPAFSAICTTNCVRCSTPPINQAVYEGTQNTMMTCNSSTKVSWLFYPTNDELFSRQITNFSDTVLAQFTNIYDVNQTDLNIKTAQSSAALPNLTTSGIYIAQYSPSGSYNKVGAKLVVVRQGPTCNCTAINSTSNEITCSITYADASYNPIYAKMTWTADGAFYSSSIVNVRTRVNGAFTSTSTITTSLYDPRAFHCNLTFAKPASVSIFYIATDAPAFYASCTAPCPLCLPNLKNIAVYEGQLNTLMNLATDPQNVEWKVHPTSDESTPYDIITVGGYRDPTLTNLYDVNQTGLVIKAATTTENGNPISTAGLYIGQCADNTNKTGAKLLVVQTGPQCSCISIDSTASNVSCSVTYGDSTLHPIYAIVTWKLNGVFLASYTLQRERIDSYVFYAESTITTNSGSPENYTCELTFAAPIDIEYPYIATNAPDFNATCTGCGR